MRDFKTLVRERVSPLGLPPGREIKIVEEWSAQLEEAYDALLADGIADADAWATLQEQLPDREAFEHELSDAGPVVPRLTEAGRAQGPPGTARRFAAWLRERLTAGLARDGRAALRLLVRERGFSAAVVVTVAICLGANVAIFTVVHAVLLRPLPIPEADRLVALGDVYPTITPNDILSNDAPSYFDRLEALTALEEQAMFAFWYDAVSIDGMAEELRGMRATPSLFRMLRVSPALGRTFTDAEGEIGAEQRIILSHGLWQRLYGGDPAAIGRDLKLGWTGRPYTIVGVMPEGFSFFDAGYDGHARAGAAQVQFWIPLAFTPEQRSDSARTRYGFFHVGRLRHGATLEQVQAQVDALHARTVERFPEFRFAELGMYTAVTPLQQALTRDVRRTLYLLWAAAGCVLVIGTLNLANLAVVRARGRARELATRLALGAPRPQLVRQLIVEGLLPAGIGGLAAVGVGAGILRVLASTDLENLPNAAGGGMDARVITCVVVVSALVGVLLGSLSAATASASALNRVLVDGGRSGTDARAARLSRRGLVVVQVALSVVLLIGAALLLTSFRHLLAVDKGFTATRVTTATLFPPPSRYPDAQAVAALSDLILDRVRALPGVEGAGMTSNIALSGFASPSTVAAAEHTPSSEPPVLASVVSITPGYLEAMGTPLVRGRRFADSDRATAQHVAIVDERLAARLWGSEDPIGQRLYRGASGPYMVVGVVRDVRFESPAAQAESIGTAYFPHAQAPPLGRLRWLAIASATDTAATMRDVRTVLAAIDPDLPLSDIQTMTERTSRSLASQSLATRLALAFGLVALLLSMLGIYGVLAYTVARRTREIGIRMALGSTARGVFRLVLGEGLALVALGVGLGLAGAAALGRVLEGQLFGVRPADPLILATVAFLAGGVALLACVAPARRAACVDPVAVLTDQ